MLSGDYNERFELCRAENIIDEKGEQTTRLTVVFRGFAKVNNLSGREFWEAYSVQQETTLQFYTRWNKVFDHLDTKRHVIRWRGRVLDITTVDNVAHGNRFCIIKAKEVDRGQNYLD